MNKLIITLAALAALSTATFAGQRTDVDLRDRMAGDINISGSISGGSVGNGTAQSAAFAVAAPHAETAFERMNRLHLEYEFGGH